jgi:hypothetical protein
MQRNLETISFKFQFYAKYLSPACIFLLIGLVLCRISCRQIYKYIYRWKRRWRCYWSSRGAGIWVPSIRYLGSIFRRIWKNYSRRLRRRSRKCNYLDLSRNVRSAGCSYLGYPRSYFARNCKNSNCLTF